MKRRLLILVVLCALTACGQTKSQISEQSGIKTSEEAGENDSVDEVEERADSDTQDSDEGETVSSAEKYAEIVEAYNYAILSGNDSYVHRFSGDIAIEPLVMSESLGYSLVDLDDDGMDELLLMTDSDDGEIFGIYTIHEGDVAVVFINHMGTERMFLCENNVICIHLSGSGFWQNFYAKFDSSNPSEFSKCFIPIESISFCSDRHIEVDGVTGLPHEFGLGYYRCDADHSEMGITAIDLLGDDIQSGSRQEWIAAIESLEGYTLIEKTEADEVDSRYILANPEITRFAGKEENAVRDTSKEIAEKDIQEGVKEEPVQEELFNGGNANKRKEVFAGSLREIKNLAITPDGIEIPSDGDAEDNSFAVADVDSDGEEELVFICTNGSMAEMFEAVYGFDEATGEVVRELIAFPDIEFYTDGIARLNASHNHSYSMSFWPYCIYKYNQETKEYDFIAEVSAWEKEFFPETMYSVFPDELDQDGDGMLFFIEEDEEGMTKDTIPVDNDEYDTWLTNTMGSASIIEIGELKLTDSMIQAYEDSDENNTLLLR